MEAESVLGGCTSLGPGTDGVGRDADKSDAAEEQEVEQEEEQEEEGAEDSEFDVEEAEGAAGGADRREELGLEARPFVGWCRDSSW